MSESIKLGREAAAIFETEVAEVAADPEAHGLDLMDPKDGDEIDMYLLANRLYMDAPKGRILKPQYRDEADLLFRFSTELSNSYDHLADPKHGPPDADERRRNRDAAMQLANWGSKMLKFYPERGKGSPLGPPVVSLTFDEWRRGKEPLTSAQRLKVDRKVKQLFAVGDELFQSPGPGFMRRHGKGIYVEYRIVNPTATEDTEEWTDYSSITDLKKERLLYPGIGIEVSWHTQERPGVFGSGDLMDRQFYTVKPEWYGEREVGVRPSQPSPQKRPSDSGEELITVSFSMDRSESVKRMAQRTGARLEDVTYEVGLYDRGAFKGPLSAWDKVHAALTDEREGTKGSERRSYTAAINRIPTTAMREKREQERQQRKREREKRRAEAADSDGWQAFDSSMFPWMSE